MTGMNTEADEKHQIYRFAWGNNPKRAAMKGQIVPDTVQPEGWDRFLIEFGNGQREITSRRALRLARQ